MSHLLHVWESPHPASVADAVGIRDRLRRVKAAPSPLYAELAARLTARFPDIGVGADDDAADAVWTDGPLAANGRGAVFGIGIRTHAVPTVVPFVVATTRALGLVVLDEESGLVFLPTGKTLGQRAAMLAWDASPPDASSSAAPLDRSHVLQTLHAALAPLLEAAGFHPGPEQWVHRLSTPVAQFSLTLQCETCDSQQDVGVFAHLVLPGLEPLALLQILSPDPIEVAVRLDALALDHGFAWPEPRSTTGATTLVETEVELQHLCRESQRVLRDALLPLVDRCSGVHKLEHVLRTHPTWFGSQHVSLVLAAVVGRDDLPALAAALIERSTLHWHDKTREWLRFLQSPPTVDLGPPLADAAQALRALPRPKHGRPILATGPDGLGPVFDDQPVVNRLVGEHYVVYGVTQGSIAAHVQQRHLVELQRSRHDLHRLALANLASLADGRWSVHTEGPILRLHLDGMHDASLLMLEPLWRGPLAKHTPNGALIAIPTAGELVFCDVAAAGGLAALRSRIAQRRADGAALLSETVFHTNRGGLESLPAPRS